MSDIEEDIRGRAYELWEHAGRPDGRSEEFWHNARLELEAKETIESRIDELSPPIVRTSVMAVEHGTPVGLPGERVVEQGVMVDRLKDLIRLASRTADD
jgi:Protein of unknown function (DUF2934)